jgi:hypothetical protein
VAPLLGVLYHESCKVWLGFILRVPTIAYKRLRVPTTTFRLVHDAAGHNGWGAKITNQNCVWPHTLSVTVGLFS